jgi:secreted Zn-dependent insulinase-like peptidase
MPHFESEEDIPHLLRHRYVADHFDRERIKEMGAHLADPNRSIMFLTSKSLDDSNLPLKEKWYNILYSTGKYSTELMSALTSPQVAENGKKLGLPPPNTLLPTNFDVLADEVQYNQVPVLIDAHEAAEIWYKQDKKFKRPKGHIELRIYTNDCNFSKNPEGRLFAELWKECLSEYLREFIYMADCAGLVCELTMYNDNIGMQWLGYSSSLPVFVEETIKMLNKFRNQDIADIFKHKKEELLQRYKNHYLQQTFRLAWGEFHYQI